MTTADSKEHSGAWPVIIHKSLTSPDLLSCLRQRNFLIRSSESVVAGSVIFPMSAGVAFLIVPLDQVVATDLVSNEVGLTPELTERVDSFVKVHRHCFLMCKAPIHGDTERQIFSIIQRRYLTTNLHMMPVHNVQEAVTCMVTVAKGLCGASGELLYSRLARMTSDIQQRDTTHLSPVAHSTDIQQRDTTHLS